MPTYLTPGVYVEEVPSANRPIEGVGTAVAAFVGRLPGGPVNTPVQISNWTQFAKTFGDPENPDNGPFMEGAYLAHSVYGFFQNGGNLCWIIRVGRDGGRDETARVALPAASDRSVEAIRAVAAKGIEGRVQIEIAEEPAPEDAKEPEPLYTMTITAGSKQEKHTGLSLKRGRANVITKVNAASEIIKLEEQSASLPETKLATGTFTLSPPPSASLELTSGDFEGDVATRKGMGIWSALDDVTMILSPDIMTLNGDGSQMRDLQGKMIAHCEMSGDRMAILDAPPDLLPQEVLDWRMNAAGYDSKMAALYYPWIEVMDPLTRQPMLIPPSGHVAGIWSRVDSTRGVHKAPANEVVLGANRLAFQVTQAEQGGLNQVGINCIRAFPGRGIRTWGARTLSSDPEWRYINVRRIFNYISESIMQGTQWSVFEPNDRALWTSLRISVSNFLMTVWRSGALFGATPGEAFFVKCDAETNPPDVVEAGQVVCEVGIAPVKPAEFVIFRLSQFTGGAGAQVSE